MIHRTPFFIPWLFPKELVWRVAADQRQLFLTFDDGPVPGPTEFVLDTLKQFNARATFFCIGDNIRKYDEVFRRIVREGHRIGNHTFNHMNGWKTADSIYFANTMRCKEIIERVVPRSGETPDLFRPPYGRISRSQIALLKEFRIVMWDVLSRDYDKTLSPESCLRNSVRASRPGSIVVFHDSFKAERNLRYVLPKFLETFASAGYTFPVL